MTALEVLPGGGQRAPVTQCRICGVAHSRPCGLLEAHLADKRLRGHTENTVYARQRALIRMGKWLAPGCVLDATVADMEAWRASLDLSHGAVASYVAHAREFFRWCCARGLRDGNPAEYLPVPRVPRRLPRPVGEEDLMRALDAAPKRIRLMIVLAAWCGLRSCEISGLLRESIMDTAVPPVLVVTIEATKGGRIERVIPLCQFAVDEVRAAGLPNRGFAFRRYDGRPGPPPPYRVSQLVNRHLHDCGVPASLHQLRHRMLSLSYKSTLDIRLVQDLAGHASPSTTAGYAQWASENAVRAVEALPAPGRLHAVRAAGHADPRTTAGYAGKA